jgi:hypothetical protein
MHMTHSDDQQYARAGANFRSNPGRFFHVMTQGWYVFTREGIRGPFVDRDRAERFVANLIADQQGDTDNDWRMGR